MRKYCRRSKIYSVRAAVASNLPAERSILAAAASPTSDSAVCARNDPDEVQHASPVRAQEPKPPALRRRPVQAHECAGGEELPPEGEGTLAERQLEECRQLHGFDWRRLSPQGPVQGC